MAPMHSLVDNLRIKNKCHQREGFTLRPQYLMHQDSREMKTVRTHPSKVVPFDYNTHSKVCIMTLVATKMHVMLRSFVVLIWMRVIEK